MKTVTTKISCDQCNADITRQPIECRDVTWRLTLSCEGRDTSGMTGGLCINPPFAPTPRDMHFCGLECVAKWATNARKV